MTAAGSASRSRSVVLRAAAALLGAAWLVFALGSSGGCGSDTPPPPPDAGPDAGPDGGPVIYSWSTPVTVDATPVVVDATQYSFSDLVAAVDPQGRPAVAYFESRTDAGTYPLILARELSDAVWTKEVVPASASGGDVTGHYGLGLAFDVQGNSLLAYQGGQFGVAKGNMDDRWHNNVTGQRMPADSVLARKSGGTWTRSTLGTLSNSFVTDGFAVDDQGEIVGLWSALGVDSTGAVHVVQQDAHYGVDQAAYDDSNLEYGNFAISGGTASLTTGEMVASNRTGPACTVGVPPCSANGQTLVQGAGNFNRLVMAGGQPAVSFVLVPYSAKGGAQQVWFAKRRGAKDWLLQRVSAAISAPGNPPSLAWSANAAAGSGPVFAIAFYDLTNGDLRLATSADGAAWDDEPVETLGVTGLHPAAAFGGDGKTLGVLYAYCRAPIDPTSQCNDTTKELRFRAGTAASGNLFSAAVEKVDSVVPDGAVLIADGQGRFVAVWRDPVAGLRASRRSP